MLILCALPGHNCLDLFERVELIFFVRMYKVRGFALPMDVGNTAWIEAPHSPELSFAAAECLRAHGPVQRQMSPLQLGSY